MKTYKRRKINYKNCYILFITIVSVISLLGNFVQNHFFTQAIDNQQTLIDEYYNDSIHTTVDSYVKDGNE